MSSVPPPPRPRNGIEYPTLPRDASKAERERWFVEGLPLLRSALARHWRQSAHRCRARLNTARGDTAGDMIWTAVGNAWAELARTRKPENIRLGALAKRAWHWPSLL